MIITRQWIQEYLDITRLSTKSICNALNSIGLEVDSTKRVLIPNGVVIGKVELCEKHPDADKLNICQVDIGDSKVQIVCGAKNVAAGQLVPVATVGAVLGDDFKIKKAKLRGVESLGMICSSTEIGLPKLNDGIMVLDDSIGNLVIGKELNEYVLINDEIIEIELTANRGDCLSIHGVARELSTYFNIPLKHFEADIITNNKGIGQIFEVNYSTCCESNLLYKAADIKNFDIKLLQNLRAATVDALKATHIETAVAYATHSTGVLLNVYTSSVSQNKNSDTISLSVNKNDNGFDTVNGNEHLSIIGVEAGHVRELSDKVIIEANYTDPEKLAQKVFDTKQKTGEIYYKASRGSETNLTFGIDYITSLISANGGTIYNGSQDFINEIHPTIITANISKINNIIGQDIDVSEITKILVSLGFGVRQPIGDSLSITIPTFRHDIKNIADITEEIVRIIGIDKIKSKPLFIEEINRVNNVSNRLLMQNQIRAKSISNGFYETVTYLFTNKENLEKYGFETINKKKDLMNPIVSELNTFRTTMALNLVSAISENYKHGFKSAALFENGIVFNKNGEEKKALGFVYSGEAEAASVENNGKPAKMDLFAFSQKISNIIGEFELEPLKKIENNFIHPYQQASVIKSGKSIGVIYKLHPNVSKDFDIDNDTYVCEIDLESLKEDIIFAQHISKYQASKRDLSIIAPKDMEYKEIKKSIDKLKIQEIKQYNLVDIYSDEKLGDKESLTINFVIQSSEKTMEENEISAIMDKILQKLGKDLDIGIR
ncbi:MAG: phenylalanine--tRNA ligase subunit beta [Campylobacterota bacterium]|nr:phenylalanine--tRNA ligase subunit beta [Campylobacterota bacterium]